MLETEKAYALQRLSEIEHQNELLTDNATRDKENYETEKYELESKLRFIHGLIYLILTMQ